MLALFRTASVEETERKLRAMAVVATLLAQEAALADATGDAMTEPWMVANRALMQQAIKRGELAATTPVATLATIIPSLGGYRSLVERKPFNHASLVADTGTHRVAGSLCEPSQEETGPAP